uniref:Uncharacterized protein n=1 Tax=Ditylenchus dipsaci TaxID=166011 RepID=A0A915CM56_9BILA
MWWYGPPSYLDDQLTSWPETKGIKTFRSDEFLLNQEVVSLATAQTASVFDLTRHSTWAKAIRVALTSEVGPGPVNLEESTAAVRMLIRETQKVYPPSPGEVTNLGLTQNDMGILQAFQGITEPRVIGGFLLWPYMDFGPPLREENEVEWEVLLGSAGSGGVAAASSACLLEAKRASTHAAAT